MKLGNRESGTGNRGRGKTKQIFTGFCVILILVGGGLFLYRRQQNKDRDLLAERIASIGRDGPPQSIEGLKSAIAVYEKQIERYVKDAAQVGIYWNILAARLQDRGLHGEALKALERGIYYSPEDPSLHYMTGISAGIVAKSLHNFTGNEEAERARLFDLAEEGFLRALELDGRFIKARYALAVLYTFELNRPAEAIPQLEKFLEISKSDVDALFILARAYYMTENYRAAMDTYDRIIYLTKDENRRIEAENNRAIMMRRIYG